MDRKGNILEGKKATSEVMSTGKSLGYSHGIFLLWDVAHVKVDRIIPDSTANNYALYYKFRA